MPWYIYVPITFLTWRGRVHAMVYLCSNDFLNLARIRPFHAMHVYLQFSNDFFTSHGCVHVVCYVFYIFVFQLLFNLSILLLLEWLHGLVLKLRTFCY